MAHRNASLSIPPEKEDRTLPDLEREPYSYGVPSSRKILTIELFLNRLPEIKYYLDRYVGLNPAEIEVSVRLIRFYAYYGKVYPKASQIAQEPELSPAMAEWREDQGLGSLPRKSYGCSIRTHWRTIFKLREAGLIEVKNRFLHGRQISNCYRLDKLILCIVRWLLEHGKRNLNLLKLPWDIFDALHLKDFWRVIWYAKVDLSKAVPVKIPIQEGCTP